MYINRGTGVGKEEKEDLDFAHKKVFIDKSDGGDGGITIDFGLSKSIV